MNQYEMKVAAAWANAVQVVNLIFTSRPLGEIGIEEWEKLLRAAQVYQDTLAKKVYALTVPDSPDDEPELVGLERQRAALQQRLIDQFGARCKALEVMVNLHGAEPDLTAEAMRQGWIPYQAENLNWWTSDRGQGRTVLFVWDREADHE